MYYFCTYFDRHYLNRGLALYESLQRCCDAFVLYVLALDDEVHDFFVRHPSGNIRVVQLDQLESGYPALVDAKQSRSRVEYYFTITPFLIAFALDQVASDDIVTYVDADLWFFASPDPLYSAMSRASVLLLPHDFPSALTHLEKFGVYNVGYLSFRKDAIGTSCVKWWGARCLEWCFDRVEDGRFAEQKYLDKWTELFPNVVAPALKGAGVAPWNLVSRPIRKHRGVLTVDGEPLIFYHFHGLRVRGRYRFHPGTSGYAQLEDEYRRFVYVPYVGELHRIARRTGAPAGGAIRSESNGTAIGAADNEVLHFWRWSIVRGRQRHQLLNGILKRIAHHLFHAATP